MKKNRNKGGNKGRNNSNTKVIQDLSELKTIIPPDKVDLQLLEEEFEIASPTTDEIELIVEPTKVSTPVVNTPAVKKTDTVKTTKTPSEHKQSHVGKRYEGVIVDITTTKVHNEILTLMIGMKENNGRPQTVRAHKSNLPKGVNFEVNDKVSFEIYEHKSKDSQFAKKNAVNVQLVAKGNAIMDKLIEKLYGSRVLITYSEGQLKTLATECASQVKSIEEMIKAIENQYKIKFIGKTSTSYVRFAFEDLG